MKKHIDGESRRLARLLTGVSSCIVSHQMPAILGAITSLAAAFDRRRLAPSTRSRVESRKEDGGQEVM